MDYRDTEEMRPPSRKGQSSADHTDTVTTELISDEIASAIPEGAKFAMITVETHSIPETSSGLIAVSDSCHVSLRPIVTLPDNWTDWLGSLLADSVRQSRLVIVTTEPARNPVVLNGQTKDLELEAQEMLVGILLQAVPRFEEGLMVSGERRSGEIDFRTLTRLDPFYFAPGWIGPVVSAAILPEAYRIARSLRQFHRAGLQERMRLRRGMQSWRRGIQERFADERLHEFVRALDAVMLLRRGGSRKDFMRKGQVLVGRSALAEAILAELYDLRSDTEHLNDFDETAALGAYLPEDRELIGLLRSCQAHFLASETYRRILLNEELHAYFIDDATINRLWGLSEAELRQLWGTPIDLDLVAQGRFLDPETGDRPNLGLTTKDRREVRDSEACRRSRAGT